MNQRRRAVMEHLKQGFTDAWAKGQFELAADLNTLYTKFEHMSDKEWEQEYSIEI